METTSAEIEITSSNVNDFMDNFIENLNSIIFTKNENIFFQYKIVNITCMNAIVTLNLKNNNFLNDIILRMDHELQKLIQETLSKQHIKNYSLRFSESFPDIFMIYFK